MIKEIQKERNFSFLHKNIDSFDSTTDNKSIFFIPAPIGSTYWAILKIMFTNFGQKVSISDLTDGVKNIMQENNPEKWEKYTNKKSSTVFYKLTDTVSQKKARTWQMRVISNAKALTRKSSYGKRLNEIGYKLIYKSAGKEPFFLLDKI